MATSSSTPYKHHQIGLDFLRFSIETGLAFVRDTAWRPKLKHIYCKDFKRSKAQFHLPPFDAVMRALENCGIIHRQGDTIVLNNKNGVAHPRPVQTFTSRVQKNLANRADNQGIIITSDQHFENGQLHLTVQEGYEHTVNLTVKNTGKKSVLFTRYTTLYHAPFMTLMDEFGVTKENPLRLKGGDIYEIKVFFHFKEVGLYNVTLIFEFRADQPHSNLFYILRFIDAHYISSLEQELASKAPYRRQSRPARSSKHGSKTLDWSRPKRAKEKNEVPLKSYNRPPYVTLTKQKDLMESPLSWNNYTKKLQLQIYLEDHQLTMEINCYNIPNDEREYAVISRDPGSKNHFVLEVPGVSENRPSVLPGDRLFLYLIEEPQFKYYCSVHRVELNNIIFECGANLLHHFVDGMKFGVIFSFNRLNLYLQHRAAEMATKDGNMEKVLFPCAPAYYSQPSNLPKLRLFNSMLEKNPEQYQVIQQIVAGSSKPAPYLVFGPPGTGKTVTLVEAIKQIEKTQASCHILACTPCNSAADLLCRKLVDHVDKRKVYRMYAKSCDPRNIPEELKMCSNLIRNEFDFPAKEKLMEYKIIVTTLFTAGRLVTKGIPAQHFTHIFIDEAGQATESECIIPLAGLLSAETGQVVLAGDPQQLGPILRSPLVLKHKMGESLLKRLIKNVRLYEKKDGVFDRRFITKLLYNYRSHPAILKIPNDLFYDGELQCHADEISRNSYCKWEHLPKQDFPLIFHSVTGIEEREASSPSFFNCAEVKVLMDYVKKLLQTQGKKGIPTMSPKDIGIIAPYRKQVQKICQGLEKMKDNFSCGNINDLKVGSVEDFQGQERRVIMVSTVRSIPNDAKVDQHFNLGFVKNDKRFNVAVTRAKALLIVVGNPEVLKTDSTWKRFIKHCSDGGGCVGVMCQLVVEDDLLKKLADLNIEPEA